MKIAAGVIKRHPAGTDKVKYEVEIAGGDGFYVDQVFVTVNLSSSQTQVDAQIKDAVVSFVNDPNNATGLPAVTANDVTLR